MFENDLKSLASFHYDGRQLIYTQFSQHRVIFSNHGMVPVFSITTKAPSGNKNPAVLQLALAL